MWFLFGLSSVNQNHAIMSFKIKYTLVLLTICLIRIQAWMMIGSFKNPGYPGKCYIDANTILTPGQSFKSPQNCSKIVCANENGMADIVGCASIVPPRNCKWAGYDNVADPYPLCCVEKYVCEDPDDEPQAKELQQHIREMFREQLKSKNDN